MPDYRSYSQLSDYEKCPQSYYLKRVERVWKRPAAWLAMGVAIHAAAETWERRNAAADGNYSDYRTDALSVFEESYFDQINKDLEGTPNTRVWFNSGPYDGGKDIDRRFKLGKEHVKRYVYFREPGGTGDFHDPWVTPDGVLAVELPFSIELNGVEIRGSIDNVTRLLEDLRVRDIKSGAVPVDPSQLALYGLAVTYLYSEQVKYGDYFLTKTGVTTYPYTLDEITDLPARFEAMDKAVKAGDFPAKPEPKKCERCDVLTSCPFAAM